MEQADIGGVRRTDNIPASTGDAPQPETLLVSLTEAATLLGVSRWTIYQLINRGDLVAVRIDRRRLIARADLEAFIAKLRAETSSHV